MGIGMSRVDVCTRVNVLYMCCVCVWCGCVGVWASCGRASLTIICGGAVWWLDVMVVVVCVKQ